MRPLIIFCALFSVLVFVDSCKKPENDISFTPKELKDPPILTPSTNTDSSHVSTGIYKDLSTIFDLYAPAAKTVTINPSKGLEFYGNSGTKYFFPPNAYQTSTGAAVTGNMQAQVTEYLTKEQMIFSGVLPYSNGDYLLSAGEVNVELTQNGQKVYFKQGQAYQASIPLNGNKPDSMSLFVGQPTNDNRNRVNWTPAPPDTTATVRRVFSYGIDTIKLFNDGMGFANCDRFWSVPKVSNSTIVITGISIENATDIAAYQSVDGRNTVIRMVQNKNTPNISLDFSPSLASHFVVAAIVKGEFYASVLAVSPQNNKVYTATLEKQTPEQFRAKLKAL